MALSSCEAEFMAATVAACQGVWLRNLLTEITDMKQGPMVIYIDNKSPIDLARNPVFHGRSKHNIRYHFIQECLKRGEIIIKHVRSEEQRANVFSKSLPAVKFEKMRALLGIQKVQDKV